MRQIGAAGGTAALLLVGLGMPAPAEGANAAVRVLEAEGMSATRGAIVRARSAAGGRALALRPKGEARADVSTHDVGAVVLRARTSRCRKGPLLVKANGGEWLRVGARGRWKHHRVELTLPHGTHDLRVRFAGGRPAKCRMLLDRLKLRGGPAVAAPAPAPPPPAAAPAPVRRLPLGASVIVEKLQTDLVYSRALEAHFASVTAENEMKMEWLQPEEGRWNFAAADALVDFATARGIAVRGHALIFGKQTPPWVGRKLLPGDVEKAMRDHIFQVMKRYAGRVRTWDVVNEAFDEDGSYKPNPFYDRLGPAYVERAFELAREADPTARLVYNEFNAETSNPRRASTFELVKALKARGLIDAVGLQLHTALGKEPTQAQLEETIRMYEAIGVEVEITEMDVIAKGEGTPESLPSRLARQADVYRSAAMACALIAACKALTVWGVSDRYSWQGVDQLPLLLDAEFRPKPALDAVRSVIG